MFQRYGGVLLLIGIRLIRANSDGARSQANGCTSCGGAIRDSWGGWKLGFYKFIGICSIVEAKLWGVYVHLLCAWDLGLRQVIVEDDSADVIRLIRNPSASANGPLLLLHIDALCNRVCDVKFQQVARSGNIIVGRMAKLADSGDFDVYKFIVPHMAVVDLLVADGNI
ncbi:hypothetical protein GQ457_06G019070 [Hibiscus cannabinus]